MSRVLGSALHRARPCSLQKSSSRTLAPVLQVRLLFVVINSVIASSLACPQIQQDMTLGVLTRHFRAFGKAQGRIKAEGKVGGQ